MWRYLQLGAKWQIMDEAELRKGLLDVRFGEDLTLISGMK